MFKNVFISISAAALLFTGLASNVSVSAQEPFVADENFNVVVSGDCNLAMRFPKNGLLYWTLGIDDINNPSIYSKDGNSAAIEFNYSGIPGFYTSFYENSEVKNYDIKCNEFVEFDNFVQDFYITNGHKELATSVDELTNFTTESKNQITKIKKFELINDDIHKLAYIFENKDGLVYELKKMENVDILPPDKLTIQFDSLSPSRSNVYKCFADVSYDTAFSETICNIRKDSIVGGYPDGTYKVNNPVTRGEMAVFIQRAFNIPLNKDCVSFLDMNDSTGFYDEAMSLRCAGIIGGYSDGTYGPGRLVSRGEMAVFIKKAAEYKLSTDIKVTVDPCNDFSDVSPEDDFYTEIMAIRCGGVISGYPDGTYGSANPVTRGELSVFIDKARKL